MQRRTQDNSKKQRIKVGYKYERKSVRQEGELKGTPQRQRKKNDEPLQRKESRVQLNQRGSLCQQLKSLCKDVTHSEPEDISLAVSW